jgi:hypothetical protein
VIFDFVIPHQIMVLYLMVLASNVGVFWNLCYFVYNEAVPGQAELKAWFRPFRIGFGIAYGACLVFMIFPLTGAYCR